MWRDSCCLIALPTTDHVYFPAHKNDEQNIYTYPWSFDPDTVTASLAGSPILGHLQDRRESYV